MGAGVGVDADDPSFGAGPPASFTLDGGDFFAPKAHDAWTDELHKDSAAWSACCWVKPQSGNNYLLENSAIPGTSEGIGWYITADRPTLNINNGAGVQTTDGAGSTISNNAWLFTALTLDETSGSGLHWFKNGATDGTDDPTFVSPGSGPADNLLHIGYNEDQSLMDPNLTEYGAIACWQGTTLTDQNMIDIFDNTTGYWNA